MPIFLRRSLLVLAIATLAIALAAAGGYAWLQTKPGQAWLAESLSSWASSPSMRVSIEELGGSIPFDMHAARIELADADGAWLTVEQAELAIAPRALLARRLDVRRIAANSLTMHRMRATSQPAAPGAPQLPSMPHLPIDVTVDALHIEQLHLAPAVLGEPLRATLTASGRLSRQTLEANLLVRRTDEVPGQAAVSIALRDSDQLAVHAELIEPTGRIAQTILGTDQPAPVTVTARGAGGLDSWRGTLSARAGELARLDAEIGLEIRDLTRINTKGELDIRGLRPPRLEGLIPGPIAFSGHAAIQGDVLRLEALELTSGTVSIKGQGRYDSAAAQYAGEATAHLRDLAPLGAAIATPLEGSAEVHVAVNGTADAPQARTTLSARDIRSGNVGADHLSASIDLAREEQAWRITAAGAVDDIATPVGGFETVPEVAWNLRAVADHDFTRIDLEHFRADGNGVAIFASGGGTSLDGTPRLAGSARLEIAALDQLNAIAGVPLQGSLAVKADAEATGPVATVKLSGETTGFDTGIPALDALLGQRPAFTATLTRVSDGSVAINPARVDGAGVALTAQATISADAERIAGTAQLELPKLAPLGAALGTSLSGSIAADARFAGPLAGPAITLHARTEALEIQGRSIDRIAAELALADPRATSGRLDATFGAGGIAGRIGADLSRPAPERVSISNLAIATPSTTVEGALDIALDGPLVSGTITGRAADLAPWSAVAGLALSGQADLRATLTAENGQSADVEASGRELRLGGTTIGRARIEARLADLLGTPSGRASLDASNFAAPAAHVESVLLTAQSTAPGVFNVGLQGSGALSPAANPAPFRVSGNGEVSLDGAERRLRVSRLDGRIGDFDIVSRTPLVLRTTTDGIHVEGLDWRIGNGQLTATASRQGESLALTARARALPLGLVRIVAPAQMLDGSFDASLNVSGTVARPQGRLDANLRGLRFATGKADVPPLAIGLQGEWRDAVLALDGRIDGPAGTKLDLSGALPLILDSRTAMPDIPQDAGIRLAARGVGLLENWAQVLPIGEDRIWGRYAVDLNVRGTIAAPEAGGRLTISDGRYINFAAGTELRDLELELTGDGRRLALRRLIATDAAEGRITGAGAIDLAASPVPAIDVTAEFSGFQAVRRDELTATADGDLRLQGPVDAATLSGNIRVQRAEIRIPDRLPAHIARFDVIEVNSAKGIVLSEPEQSGSQSTLRLDLGVDVPARAFVRGRGLDSEWRGSLRIAGTVDSPSVTGTLSVVRGDYRLLGKSFALTEGSITFLGDPDIEPQINVVAEHRAAEITARATVTGTLTSPTLALSSQPGMPQDEILARVLFGRGVGQITPAQGLQLAQAAASLAGGGPGVLERLRTTVGLDRLDISGGAENASGEPAGLTVTGGKYVTDRVFVGVEQGATTHSTRTKVEIEITPNVTVESNVGTNNAAGVGVNWRWDY